MDPDLFDAAMTARLLGEYGLQVSASPGLDDVTDVPSEDPDIVRAVRARLAMALSVLLDSGGKMLCGAIYSELGKDHAPATERGRANSIETMRWLADKAAESGISLGSEFCNRCETSIINTTGETLAMIEQIGRDNVYAHLDTYHLDIEERSFTEAVRAASVAGRLGRNLWDDATDLATQALAFTKAGLEG